MSRKVLYIIRGLSGSGKSSLGDAITNMIWDDSLENAKVLDKSRCWRKHYYSADDYFTDEEGNYNFNPNKLKEAHEDCQKNVERAMSLGHVQKIAVCNTFSQAWEAEPYFTLANKYDYSPFVVECQNDFGNVHGVPQETINAMKNRWESLT
tara:strand:- start:772 stop:1224 length:453 start_codon:yes stop_codon:yes gene_type:complete